LVDPPKPLSSTTHLSSLRRSQRKDYFWSHHYTDL
jgi:hypothetical protein